MSDETDAAALYRAATGGHRFEAGRTRSTGTGAVTSWFCDCGKSGEADGHVREAKAAYRTHISE